jgi:REP element-mobilizing transposase RayT
MSGYFSDRFKRDSRRLKGYDYSLPGYYFITISTDAQILFFGKIIDKGISLSPAGKIVKSIWNELPVKFTFISLDAFIIMPNHLHGILKIKDKSERLQTNKSTHFTQLIIQGKKSGGITGKKNPMINQDSISYVIRWFKARCTYKIRKSYPKLSFAWQSRFHDRIIKDEKSLHAARIYILNNPKMHR